MNARPALLALAVIATLAACGKKDADTAATPAAAPPAAEPAPAPAGPPPLSRFRGQAVMGKDGWGMSVCGDPQQRIVTFKPEAQAVIDGFVAGGAKEFFLDGWGNLVEGVPEFASIERVYTEGPGCDEKDLGMVLFRARGNEPFWAVDVGPSGITVERPDTEKLTIEYQPLDKTPEGGRHFAADTASGKFDLTLNPGKCSDGMSDTVYGWQAAMSIGDQAYSGCAFSGLMSE